MVAATREKDVLPVPTTAWIPVHWVTWGAPDWPDDFEQSCIELAASVQQVIRHLDERCEATAEWISDESEVPLAIVSLNRSYYGFPKHHRFLKIDGIFRMRRSNVTGPDGARVSDADLTGIAALEFAAVAEDMLLLAAIAYPGRFHTKIGQVFVGHHGLNLVESMPGFSRDYIYSEKQFWPVVGCRSITSVIT